MKGGSKITKMGELLLERGVGALNVLEVAVDDVVLHHELVREGFA